MQITSRTRTKDIAHILADPRRLEVALSAVEPARLTVSVWDMTIEDIIGLMGGELPKKYLNARRAVVFLANIKALRNEVETFCKEVARYSLPQTGEEQQAAAGVPFPSFGANIMCECQEWFGLHSLEEAKNIKVAEWFLLYQRKQAGLMYQRNYERIISSSHGKK